jgi:putative methionine-R-sulfoxide reductase with GAF domain/ribosomal protein L37E
VPRTLAGLRTSADHGWWNEIVSERESKPIRDEQTLAKVLEAAYVMQEHNRKLQKTERGPKLVKNLLGAERWPGTSSAQPQPGIASPKATSGLSLAQIVEIQHKVQVRQLGLENVMALIVERLMQIDRAGGAAIGILENNKVKYRVVAGDMALPTGTEVPLDKALCVECVRAGVVFRCADVDAEPGLDLDVCRHRGIQSMIAVPVFHNGAVAGILELYFPKPQAFTEESVHACQLMAGLVSEALARNEEVSWKKSLANDRAVMLEALEKLKPSLAALAEARAAKDLATIASVPSMAESASTFACRKCGHQLVGQEQFCGNCGSPRSTDYEAPNMQSKVASLWQMQQAMIKTSTASPANGAAIHEELPAEVHEELPAKASEELSANLDEVNLNEAVTDFIEERLSEPFTAPEGPGNETTGSTDLPETSISADFEDAERADLEISPHTIPEEIPPHAIPEEDSVEAPESTALVKTEHGAAWSSAATTLAFFERLAVAKDRGVWARFWNTRRGDIYLAIAVVMMLGVIRWGIWSNHSVSATGNPTVSAAHRRAAPDADLSLFDRILVKLGLAEAPDPPEYKGNPTTQVWLDLQTALYYCPGTDLYGKTPKGRFSSQRDAQLDQFEPAYRKACD